MPSLESIAADPRVTIRRSGMPDSDGRCLVYWMQRAQRGVDNPALDVAVATGNELRLPVVVFFAPLPLRGPANLRHYAFLAGGIPDIAADLKSRNIGFVLRRFPDHQLLKFCEEARPALVVGDENPLRAPATWREKVARKLRVPFWTVDADVIVPSKLLLKAQYAARTIRPRLHTLLPDFLHWHGNFPAHVHWKKPRSLQSLPSGFEITGFELTKRWPIDRSVQSVKTKGGSREAKKVLDRFVRHRLSGYPELRNHPEVSGTSHLSPYLHFGHLSPVTVALAVQSAKAPMAARTAFLDQLITWRELSVNFVRFNPNYDNFECGEPWAHRTLAAHARDPRPVRYSARQLEEAETHDPLWNAAQRQMVNRGWMHNYLRMYWGKKILEWSRTPAEAFDIAVQLNDKYELDGRDPNGYAGIAWSIVGKFDRAWPERPVFGKIRYMSLASTGRKFDSKTYIAQNPP